MPRLVCLSDTHLRHDFPIPDGRDTDILVHTGDFTFRGSVDEMMRAISWLGEVKAAHGYKDAVAICGNHDWLGETDPGLTKQMFTEKGITYLDQQAAVIQGLRFYGAPHTPRFFDWAFNVDRGAKIAEVWSRIPLDTQVLMTHGPPYGRLDACPPSDYREFTEHVGCRNLGMRIAELPDLKLHVFGHVHRPGIEIGAYGVTYINASICDEHYKAVHPPRVYDLEPSPPQVKA